MTQQTEETLIAGGRAYTIRELPLGACTDASVRERMTHLQASSSALWRGYLGTWEIKAGRLWLVDLEATIREHHDPTDPANWQHADRGMAWLFPGTSGPVLADWFTGVLESPRGRAQRTGQYSYGTPYTRVFHVEAGAIVGTELLDNRAALRKASKRRTAAEAVAALWVSRHLTRALGTQ